MLRTKLTYGIKDKNQLYNLPFILTFKENHIPMLGFGAKTEWM